MGSLNPQQQAAVCHGEGPLLVLAGAGSGKTRIVTYRVAYLLEKGVPADAILAVTFTNKAAQEMRHRIYELTGQSILASTFHSLCARILRESIASLGYERDFTIYDDEDSDKALRECLVSLDLKLDKGQIKSFRAQISQAKNSMLIPSEVQDELFAKVYSAYQERLKSSQALDFDDLLFITVRLFQEHPEVLKRYQSRWVFLLIDEYQDTNAAQYQLVRQLAGSRCNVFAVGDPDQSIYSWRGANVHNILRFEQDFPGAQVIALEQNYRSRSNLLQAANALIAHNQGRFEKNLWSERAAGEKIGFFLGENDHAEAEFVVQKLTWLRRTQEISYPECVIFYRTNFQSRLFEDYLLRAKIPYEIVGGLSFYQRKEIKDVLAWLKMLLTGYDMISFARTLNLPKRGIGQASIEKLQQWAQQEGISILELISKVVAGDVRYKLSLKQTQALSDYLQLIQQLRLSLTRGISLHELISELLEKTHYLNYLKEDPESYEERRQNVAELVSKAMEWEAEEPGRSLALFLEELALKPTSDTQPALECVKLMTLHSGKGLEFRAVFLVGLEEELFPHVNMINSPEGIEEERRLCYVGMTRAKDYLFLTASRSRYLWGMSKRMRPSRFLQEIPKEFLHFYHYDEQEDRSNDDEDPFGVHALVSHREFGVGEVKRVYRTSLGITYDVAFEDITRSLVGKFAKLVKVC